MQTHRHIATSYEQPRKLHLDVLDALRSFDGWTTAKAIAERAGLHELDCAILLDYWRGKDVFWDRTVLKTNEMEYLKK